MKKALQRDEDLNGILIVPDMIPANREAELLGRYPTGRVRLVGGLWFHLSIFFNMELPLDQFEPSRQRALRDEELASKGSQVTENSANELHNCIRRVMLACLN